MDTVKKCNNTEFEESIAKFLEDNGHKVYRNVQVQDEGKKYKIGIVVFDKFRPICIKCVYLNAVKIYYKRSSNNWRYFDNEYNAHWLRNPILQVNDNAKALFMGMVRELEGSFPEGVTVPSSLHAVVINGDRLDYKSENVYTEKESSLDSLLDFCNFKVAQLPEGVVGMMHEWLQKHSDN